MNVNHGANLHDLSNRYNFSKSEIMDFSSNINPLGTSPLAKNHIIENIDMVSIYPDPNYIKLKNSISSYCNCSNENILLGSGATELISSFIKNINPSKAILISPAYSEYEKELNKVDCDTVKYFSRLENNFKIDVDNLLDFSKKDKFDLIVICNPNNPTGFTFSKAEIEKIVKSFNGFVMVDETYIEFTDMDTYSSTSLVDSYDNLFVIRGTSKFFSAPGIRLGYGLLGNVNLKENISKHLDLWNINIIASSMGEIMFKDKDFISKSFKFIISEKNYIFNELSNINDLSPFYSQGNFILCEIKSKKFTAKELHKKLLLHKIIIRDCASFDGLSEYFFRVCILSDDANKLLIRHLNSIFKNS